MMNYILDEHGNPEPCPDLAKWGEWYNDPNNKRIIIQTNVTCPTTHSEVLVSTVFLGVGHNHFGGPPILWETMVSGGTHNHYQHLYYTRAAAVNGHWEIVRMVGGNTSITIPDRLPPENA